MAEHSLRVIDGGADGPPLRRKRPPARYCGHQQSEIDHRARRVTCVDCGADLDPIDVLDNLAHNFERYADACETAKRDYKRAVERLADIKRQVANAKAQLRRATAASERTRLQEDGDA